MPCCFAAVLGLRPRPPAKQELCAEHRPVTMSQLSYVVAGLDFVQSWYVVPGL